MTPVPRLALALVLAAYLLPLALPVPLMEDDEGLHAAIAQEMVERGDWVVPRLMGAPFLDKPILYFWMQAASLKAFGDSEFAVRLPGTAVALAGALATGWLARALFGGAAGIWAALCYATMAFPYAVSLAPLHDLVMVPLAAVAVGAFWRARHASGAGPTFVWTLVAGTALGLSVLGKGLTGVGLVGIGTAAWLLWTRALSWRLVAVGAGALLIAAAIAWPWYAAMEHASPGYLHYFFLERHVAGVTDQTQRHAGRPFWYYVPVVVGGTLPWLGYAWRRRPWSDAERLLLAWFVLDVVVLSAAGSKLATYLLPAFPAVAALAAARIASGPPLPLAAVSGWSTPSKVLAGTALALVLAAVFVRPVVARGLSARALAERINAAGALPPRVYIVDEGVGSFVFYLRPELRRHLAPDGVLRISRFSLGDVLGEAGSVAAIAVDRVPGVAELYDLGPQASPSSAGDFLVVPLEQVHRRLSPR